MLSELTVLKHLNMKSVYPCGVSNL